MALGNNGQNGSGPWGQGPWGKKPEGPANDDLDEFIKKGQEKIRDLFPGGKKGGPDNNKKFIATIGIIFIGVWLATGLFQIKAGQEGIILRFGAYTRTVGPGLSYHLPYPIEKREIVNIQKVRTEEIGFRSPNQTSRNRQSEKGLLNESLMLTGDENIVDVELDVQWNIKDSKSFLFNVRDNYFENTVKSAAESSIRDVIGETAYTKAIEGEGRNVIETNTKEQLQKILDSYKMGVNITSVQLKPIDPPAQVIDAFRDVQSARADKERDINKAEAYRNDIIPRAKGDAERILQEAEGYKNEVVAKAEGEANRFVSVYEEYRLAKDVTKRRIYLETMEEILNGMDKILIDNDAQGSGVVPYLPLNELKKTQ